MRDISLACGEVGDDMESACAVLRVLCCIFVLVAVAPGPAFSETLGNDLPCNLTRGYSGVVRSVVDARTVVLEGGETVRLSGLAPEDLVDAHADGPPEASRDFGGVDALSQMVVGQAVFVAPVKPARTRYGSTQAHVFVETRKPENESSARVWVQAALVKGGHARVYEPVGQSDCGDTLIEFERVAVASKVGLWTRAKYRAIDALHVRALVGLKGALRRVRGRVVKVAARRQWTYLNFGGDWRRDFTVAIPTRLRREYQDWAKTLGELEGKIVEVSGWIDVRNGPIVELERPGLLHVVSEGEAVETSKGAEQ